MRLWEAVLLALALSGGARLIAWGTPFLGECRQGLNNFWYCWACMSYGLAPSSHKKGHEYLRFSTNTRSYSSAEMQSVYPTYPADWVEYNNYSVSNVLEIPTIKTTLKNAEKPFLALQLLLFVWFVFLDIYPLYHLLFFQNVFTEHKQYQ